jgi:mono/diheme cytochrome c family protein
MRSVAWAAATFMAAALTVGAQQPPPPGGRGQDGAGRGGAAGRGGGGGGAYPQRPPGDPAVVDRGKALYSVNCQLCHGADTRGGDSGPSLLRSQLVQNDQNGEVIAPVVQNGRPPRMPTFDFTPGQIADLAAFLHTFRINSRDPARIRPESIVTGDAAAGQTYFTAKCASCHSVTGDLKGLAGRFPDPRALQQWWLMPDGASTGDQEIRRCAVVQTEPPGLLTSCSNATLRPTTATITFRNGPTFEGRLVRIDEFTVVVMEPDGTTRSFRRDGENPNVDVHDPLQPHKALLRVYSDKDIHDVTAYLVKLP